MNISPFAEVKLRLVEAVERMPGKPSNTEEEYERWEYSAIAILDSEYANFPEGDLCRYLIGYLAVKHQELGLEASEEIWFRL